MAKRICLNCASYRHGETVCTGHEYVGGCVCVPTVDRTEPHCVKDQEAFARWWEENKDRTDDNVLESPSCFELAEGLKGLDSLTKLAREIASDLKCGTADQTNAEDDMGGGQEGVQEGCCKKGVMTREMCEELCTMMDTSDGKGEE